ncbi:polysaccharide deacetylase family protein [bacterium]|nr:polysaccharide deacetylase family protein [bacterium]
MILSQTPALLYHKVDTQREIGVTRISPEVFKRHMMMLKNDGWETILPGENNFYHPSPPSAVGEGQGGVTSSDSELTSAKITCLIRNPPFYSPLLCRGDAPPSKHFHLVFDDGYEGIYKYAFPILEEFGYKATVFIPSGFISKDNTWDYHFFGRPFRHMNRQMLRELVKAGWMIGSHGIGHIDLMRLNDEQLKRDLVDSKKSLSEIINDEVKWISFPFGRYGKREIDAAIEAGYIGTVSHVNKKFKGVSKEFTLIFADAIYSWDPTGIIPGRLNRGFGYGAGRLFRMVTNKCSYGTILYKRLFGGNNLAEPLATDE